MSRVTPERLAELKDYELIWVPQRDGAVACATCGAWSVEQPNTCGHVLCGACQRLSREREHLLECVGVEDEPTAVFSRANRDCLGCRGRHPDWERCADELWREYQRRRDAKRNGGKR